MTETAGIPRIPSIPPHVRDDIRQVATHGRSGLSHLSAAAAPTASPTERLEHLVRATDAFGHALNDASSLPLADRVLGPYVRGYETATKAAEALAASGVIPAVRKHYGRAEMLDARDGFNFGVDLYRDSRDTGRSPEDRRSAGRRSRDWLAHSFGDAASGAFILRDVPLGAKLLGNLGKVRLMTTFGRSISDDTVTGVNELFDIAIAKFNVVTTPSLDAPSATPQEPPASAPASEPNSAPTIN